MLSSSISMQTAFVHPFSSVYSGQQLRRASISPYAPLHPRSRLFTTIHARTITPPNNNNYTEGSDTRGYSASSTTASRPRQAHVEEYTKQTSLRDAVTIRIQPSCLPHSRRADAPPTTVLFGWFAANPKHVARYAAIFEKMGHNTAHLVAPVSAFFALDPADLARYVISVVRIIAGDVRLTNGGIVLFFMSNGGALCSMHLTGMLTGHPRYQDFLTPSDTDAFSMLKDAMATVLYDSAPCYPHDDVVAKACMEGLKVPKGPSTWVFRRYFDVYSWFQKHLMCNLPKLFWATMLDADYPCPEQYMYSTGDHLLDAPLLDALVEHRKRKGKDVRVLRADAVKHLLIFKTMPKEYLRTLRDVNDWGVNVYRRKVGLSQWRMEGR